MRRTALLGVILDAATAAISACDGRGETPASGLFVVARDGSGLKRLAGDARPVWSPDGRRIAFAAPRPCILCGPSDVYVVAADGARSRGLPRAPRFRVGTGCRS